MAVEGAGDKEGGEEDAALPLSPPYLPWLSHEVAPKTPGCDSWLI